MVTKLDWHDLRDLGVQGRGWTDTAHPYDRLPVRAEALVPEPVWDLSRQSTGFYVDFRSNAAELHARTVLRVPPHEHQSYIKYLDLYPAMRRDRESNRAAFRALCDRLRAGGAASLAYAEGDPLLGGDSEATVDGSHPSDLGFVRYADCLQPIIANSIRMTK